MLRKFGNVHYVSKRLKYVVVYCNMDEAERIAAKIGSYSFVKQVDLSYRPFLKVEFESKLDKAKATQAFIAGQCVAGNSRVRISDM